MKTKLLGYRSSAPVICGVCGRLAHGVGYIKPNETKPDILWTCRKHVHLAKRVFEMSETKLSQYENAAVTRAKEEAVDSFLQAVLDVMWNEGVRSLEDLGTDKYTDVLESARMDKDVQASFEMFMTSYSAYLDKIMSGEEAPF